LTVTANVTWILAGFTLVTNSLNGSLSADRVQGEADHSKLVIHSSAVSVVQQGYRKKL
jgi:hypothetical protein